MIKKIIIISLFAYSSLTTPQGVYKWVDEDGVTHFSDKPVNQRAERIELKVKQPEVPQQQEEKIVLESPSIKRQPEIIMYGAAWCGVCKQARSYFKKKNIKYTEYDIDTSDKGKRDYKRMKGNGVPLFLIDGKRFNGFNTSRFDQILKKSEK